MVRSALAVLALLILPGFASAQVAGGSHTVVDGDTLWDLAQRYYGNPFDWRRIWMANQAEIDNPNLILPTQVIIIPGIDGPMPSPADEEPAMVDMPAPAEGEMRTIFYRDSTAQSGIVGSSDVDYIAVPRDVAYSAPRLIPLETEPEFTGTIIGAAGRASRSSTVTSYERVSLDMKTPVRVGDQLQVFTVSRSIEDVGQVVMPTGVISVATVDGDGVTGVVIQVYGRIEPGSMIGPIPDYSLAPGEYAEPVTNGPAAMVTGFAGTMTLLDLGAIAFLDLGQDDGLAIGDEFSLYNSDVNGLVDGALQVVGVSEESAAVRVVSLTDAVFHQGTVVRLSKKMR